MRKYNINDSIIRAIENLYDKARSSVLFNGSTGEWLRATVGVRHRCLLSPTLFNIFLEKITCEALDHEGSVSIGGQFITNFRFADDIVVNGEEEEEAGVLIDLCLAHRGSTVSFLLLQCSSGVVRHPRDLQVSVATHFCRVLIFASSQYLSVIFVSRDDPLMS